MLSPISRPETLLPSTSDAIGQPPSNGHSHPPGPRSGRVRAHPDGNHWLFRQRSSCSGRRNRGRRTCPDEGCGTGPISLATESKMPTRSGPCPADQRRSKLSDIVSSSRSSGRLTFLSVCRAGMGDKDLSDQAIHIQVVAGMLFAGYGALLARCTSRSRIALRLAVWQGT